MTDYLCLLVDVVDETEFKGDFYSHLNKTIPNFIRVSSLTGGFKKIMVTAYNDYGVPGDKTVIRSTNWCEPNDQALIDFGKNLRPHNGWGVKKAVKTGLWFILNNLPTSLDETNDKIHVLHLTDGGHPHYGKVLDRGGNYELEELGKQNFDWIHIASEFSKKPIIYNVYCNTKCGSNSYLAYTPVQPKGVARYEYNPHSYLLAGSARYEYNPHSYLPVQYTRNEYGLYSYLADLTGGFCCLTSSSNLDLDSIFNGWFGSDVPIKTRVIPKACFVDIHSNEWNGSIKTFQKDPFMTEIQIANCILEERPLIITQPNFKLLLDNITKRLKNDDKYKNMVFELFKDIIENDMLSLTANKLFGRIWRQICTMRYDDNREELLKLMNIEKKKLNESQKTKFEGWIRESYNMIEEIDQELNELFERKLEPGYIEFIRDNEDNEDNPEPADTFNMLKDLSKKGQLEFKNMFVRMTINQNKNWSVDIKNSIPISISSDRIFSLLMHIVSPGTKISGRRYQAILAMLSLDTILDKYAKDFLNKFKGKWLCWDLDDNGNPVFPENYQSTFLYLCKDNKDFFTDLEYAKILRLTKLSLCHKIPNMNISIAYNDFTSIDGTRPDHHIVCSVCNISRPISLILPKQIGFLKKFLYGDSDKFKCGYCVYNILPKIVQTPDQTYMIRCSKCEAFYSRDRGRKILGKSQCHECLKNGTPSNIKCVKCGYKFVTYNDIPLSTCKPCQLGDKPLIINQSEEIVNLGQLFSENDKESTINGLVGFTWKKENQPLYQMDIDLSECQNITPQIVKNEDFFWDNKRVINMSDIVDKIITSIDTHDIEYMSCALCCETKSELSRACGRKNCKSMICNDCGNQWYGENKLGFIVNVRKCKCMFCDRLPSHHVIKKWWTKDAESLKGRTPEMDSTKYYAWCVSCKGIKVCGERECGDGEIPSFDNFKCELCISVKLENYKHCPSCNAPTYKYAGCNHMICICGIIWCYECGNQFESSEIYFHMYSVHGRIYDYDEPWLTSSDDDMPDLE
uniref:RING-type domain-containing protein n=1 Tax=viral metagenome TaxID=1070528 RepID=A0A6C0J8J9_9ZZZZ